MTDNSTPQPSGPIEPGDPDLSGQQSVSGQQSTPSGPSESDASSGALNPAPEPPPLSPNELTRTSPEATWAPPAEPDTYRVGNVFGWALLAFLGMWPLMILAQAITFWIGPVAWALVALAVALLPIVWAAVKFRRATTKLAATPWLGILIGSALFLLIFGGSCVTLLLTIQW